MEPGVPFALLGAGTLLAVAAWTALAAVAAPRLSATGRRGAAALLVVGALLLAVVDAVTGLRVGSTSSELLPTARTAGLLLVAGGLYAGGLPARREVPTPTPAVVAPLAAPLPPSVLAAAAGLATAAAALRTRRDAAGVLVALGLLLGAAAAGAAPLADEGSGALAVLLLRTAGAVLVLAGLVALARASVLGKVVAAILAGVLVMAGAAVGVVGTVVAGAAEDEQAGLVQDAAQGRLDLLARARESASAFTSVAAPTCVRRPDACDAVLRDLAAPGTGNFAALLPADGTPQVLGGAAPLDPAEALGLAGSDTVALALAGGANRVPESGLAATVRLVGGAPGLANVVVVPLERPVPDAAAPRAFVYGVRLDDDYVRQDTLSGGFGFSLLVGGDVVASNLTDADRARVERLADEAGVAQGLDGDGRTLPAEGRSPTVHFAPLTGLDGEPVGTVALSREAQEALRSQRGSLRALLLTALVATAVVGGLALLLGRRTVEPLQRLTAAASRVAAGDLAVRTGVRSRDEVGVLSRTFDEMTGSVARLTGDLRASAARLETVLSSMTDGLVSADGQGRVTSVNRAAVEMTGLPDEAAALGRPLDDVVGVRTGAGPLPLAPGPEVDAEVHPVDGGPPVPVRVGVEPLEGGEGLLVVLRDTTREREVERMKTEFLSNVSHELRTPLTPIRGYADILVSRPGLPADKVTTFATTILAESLKMNRVVDLLVDVAAIEAGRVTVTPRPVAPGALVDARLEAWRAKAPERAGDLKRRVAARLPQVLVDPEWLGKALDELVDNALKHAPAGTTVTLTAAAAGDRVRVAVRDNGPGIAEADRALLFTSFEQVDGSATRRVGGLGLGLSFVRRLADDAGWPLTVTSTPGRGSEFALDLPVAAVEPRPRPRRTARS